jgi:hypothetical protein
MNLAQLRKVSYFTGIALFLVAAVLMLSHSLGMVTFDSLMPGESPVHSIARVAVIGCLLAAVGSIE